MQKVWTIAKREYSAMVATKAFLVSIVLMPVLMFGGIFVTKLLDKVRDVTSKSLVVVDGTDGQIFGDLEAAAKAHNQAATQQAPPGAPVEMYVIERHGARELTDEDRLELSDRIRRGAIKAFVEVPADIAAVDDAAGRDRQVRFYGQNAMLSAERRWVEETLNNAITARRLAAMQLDPAVVRRATAPVVVAPLGIFKRTSDGAVRGADEKQGMAGLFVPFGFMMLMFMVIFLAAQPLLEGVMEEKTGRIAEVLLGSVNSFQLMLGKLLGNVGGSLSVVAIYAIGGYIAARYNNWIDLVPMHLVPWFIAFQGLGVLFFSAIFLAVGAAVTQAKEAQSLLLPVWLIMMCPMFAWLPIVREPNGTIATWMSFIPPLAPLVMVLRLASETVIPLWQIWASLALLVLATACGVYLAGRIFRVGILWQGKSPKMTELFRWAFRG